MGLIHDKICKGGCNTCHGSKLVADTENGLDPWCAWAELPPGSDLAIRLGLVKSITCPDCAPGVSEGRRLNIRSQD